MSDASAARGGRKDPADGKQTGDRTGPLTFYRQVVAELRKVVYPTREQLVTYFFVVLFFVLVMIAIVSLLDLGLGKLAFEVFTGADDI
ncbi:preprotein translocase subunit SecE [Nocardioides caeni]|uniref:preprotein translocase subunit SecE n=1 Tax=Nocardioides caeni TaxID=574700 RepID=UPI0013052F9F|nr:preprotein translocase subunit SecE [Nocardioides caeni]